MHTYTEFCRTFIDKIQFKNEMSISTSLVSTYTITFLLTSIGATHLIELGLALVVKVREFMSKFFRFRAGGTIDIVWLSYHQIGANSESVAIAKMCPKLSPHAAIHSKNAPCFCAA